MELKILKYYIDCTKEIDNLDFEADSKGKRPAWIQIKNLKFNARFIAIRTNTNSEDLYKKFTGNFYYPLEGMTEEEERRFYAKYAQYYDQNTAKNNLPMAEFLLEKLSKYNISIKSKILDLGAGTGLFSNLAALKGYKKLTLVDRSREMLKQARKKPNLKKAQFVVGDVTKIELDDNYDVFVSVMLFDNLNNKELEITLERFDKKLKKDGYIFLMEDKHREEYDRHFNRVETGMFEYSKKGSVKYYFIGRKK